jgi:hypothetical protein
MTLSGHRFARYWADKPVPAQLMEKQKKAKKDDDD